MLDLHVHTCLSPCGDLDMHPAALVARAGAAGLDAVAVCDHNSASNVAAAIRAGTAAGVSVIPGMEVASEEEVHVLAWLPDAASADRLQRQVYDALPGLNDARLFGPQAIVLESGVVAGFEERLLIGATRWSLDRAIDAIHAAGGLAAPAHVDRERFGLIGQLGLVPDGLRADAFEVSPRCALPAGRALVGDAGPVVTGSDAHQLDQIGRAVTYWLVERPDCAELARALREQDGRALLGGGRPMEELSLHILDVARNAIEAGASRVDVTVEEDARTDRLVIDIRDNGRGMDAAAVARATDPYFTTRPTRAVGLGLPMLAAAARAAGGGVSIESTPGRGTRVHATFVHGHIDRAPLGDLETTVLVLCAGAPDVRFELRHRIDADIFELDTDAVRAGLGGEPLTSPRGLAALRAAVREGEARLARAAHGAKGVA